VTGLRNRLASEHTDDIPSPGAGCLPPDGCDFRLGRRWPPARLGFLALDSALPSRAKSQCTASRRSRAAMRCPPTAMPLRKTIVCVSFPPV